MRHLTPTVLAILALAACGDDPARDTDTSDTQDGADTDASDTTDTNDLDVSDTNDPDAHDTDDPDLSDAHDTAEPDTRVPVACGEREACAGALVGDELCPDLCFSTDDRLTCPGVVVHSLCHSITPVDTPTEEVTFGTLRVTPVKVPEDARVGDTADLEVRLTNVGTSRIVIPFGWKNPDTWTLEDLSWQALTEVALDPDQSLSLTAKLTARNATTLSSGGDIIVTFILGDDRYEPRAVVHFADSEPILCGGERFPAMRCRDGVCGGQSDLYATAMCCDGIFYPGALCCADPDCNGGACVDGKCVFEVPALGSANGVPLGHQKIRLVLVDTHLQYADPCANHYADFVAESDLTQVEAWFDAVSQARLGRDAMDIEWVVTGGVQTSDFLKGPNDWTSFSHDLDAWLRDRGCPLLDTYDKIIVAASSADLMGFGGLYHSDGHIVVQSAYQPLLLAHELAHSFGATDLYLDLAGPLLYPFELMTSYFGDAPAPGDRVAWGQMGFADLDRDGVLDLVDFAAFPDTLEVRDLTATITNKGTVELHWEFVGLEEPLDGAPADPPGNTEGLPAKRVVVPSYRIQVPAANLDFVHSWYGRVKSVVIDQSQLDLPAIESAGTLEVHLTAAIRVTGRDWVTRLVSLDRTYQAPVSRAGR